MEKKISKTTVTENKETARCTRKENKPNHIRDSKHTTRENKENPTTDDTQRDTLNKTGRGGWHFDPSTGMWKRGKLYRLLDRDMNTSFL